MFPQFRYIRFFKVVNGELHFLQVPDFTIGDVTGPYHVIEGVDVLQESGDALQPVGDFGRDGIEILAATLLEVGELGNLQTVEHDLPAHPPGPQGRRFPVVFFKLEIMLAQVNADRLQRFQVDFLHVDRRRFQHHLELGVLEKPVGILAVAPIGRTAGGLRVGHRKRPRIQHTQKGFRRHGAGAHFYVIRLLQNASTLGPKGLQTKEEFLEGKGAGYLRCHGWILNQTFGPAVLQEATPWPFKAVTQSRNRYKLGSLFESRRSLPCKAESWALPYRFSSSPWSRTNQWFQKQVSSPG